MTIRGEKTGQRLDNHSSTCNFVVAVGGTKWKQIVSWGFHRTKGEKVVSLVSSWSNDLEGGR